MPHTVHPADLRQLAIAVRTLNIRWSRRALALWQGLPVSGSPEAVYDGFEALLTPERIEAAGSIADAVTRTRIRHGLIDHYLQRHLMPHETEMQAWSRGAAAHVDGEKIYFKDIIPWCQKSSTLKKRRQLQQETGPLCKLLKPFAVNYWNTVIEILTEKLGFAGYVDYCRHKKGIDYAALYRQVRQLIEETAPFYLDAMNAWSRDRFRRPLEALTRFDAMYLLSLSQWDALCPAAPPDQTLEFFACWQIDPGQLSGLHLDLESAPAKSAQAITIMVRIPDEVHLLMRPQGGWIDLESLWHELGHGLSAVFCDPALPMVTRELATGFSLSETYAFLLQRLVLSRPILKRVLRLPESTIATIRHYRSLKDLSVFRRYAAKFISEYEMFSSGEMTDGRPYAEIMGRVTGFTHQPESHLFDLVPEFYCADYLMGWMGEAQLEAHLRRRWGEDWCFDADAGQWLKGIWRQGNPADISAFFESNGLGPLSTDALLHRWNDLASGSIRIRRPRSAAGR